MSTAGYFDRTKLNAEVTNLGAGITADSEALEAYLIEVADQSDANWGYLASLVANGPLSPYPAFMSRNAIINGNFDVAQRGTSFTIATGVAAYTLDRWLCINNGSGVNATATQATVSDLDGSSFGLQLVHATAPASGGKLSAYYTMEARDSYKLAGKKATISVKVKGVLAMDKVTVNVKYNTTETAITFGSTLIGSSDLQIINNSSWTTITFTVTMPSRAALTMSGVIGIEIYASKSTAEASGEGYILAQAQICGGDVALPFQPRSVAEELQLCQRYYSKTFPNSVTPANNGGRPNALGVFTLATAEPTYRYSYPVTMRTTPTITLYNPAAGTVGQWLNTGTLATSANASVAWAGDKLAFIANGGVSLAAGIWEIHAANDAEI